MPDPSDRGRREPERDEGLSNLASAYRKAGPYIAASTQLVVSVGAFTALGIWLDRKWEHQTPWLTLLGAALGMTSGFISFFRTVLGKRK
ncbi:MAG TPA: AtpZ/AtpI family protein [Anaeromyxobacteraceae bacterium]|nr:AtpZ/AtpI family protein [Anaeromyxobacteraceae bacterium]